ncbi:MAG: D-alanyl-D-alanine carboxypeptidase family protein [Paracoccaceae bacterium]
MFLVGITVLAACSAARQSDAAPYAAYVMDARTGQTLYSENADTRLHPASLTKMMTLYITFQEIERGNISLDSIVTVSKNAAAQPPSRLGLKAGQKIAVRYLIRAAAVKSANDAAAALGDFIGGNQANFATRMTKTARALGMANTTFKNANGLTAPGHLSTAHDMSILGRHLFYDFPQYYNIFSRRTADAGVAQVASTNRRFLDAYEGADGIKTGYTVPAGFNLTASAQRGNVRIIATVFGGQSTAHRNQKVSELLDLGFRKAPANTNTKVPAAPAYTGDDLIADADTDLPEVAGGAGKTIRVSMAMQSSRRPAARPDAAHVAAAAVAVAAMQDDIAGALAEATAPEPEPGTLDAQVAALNENTDEEAAEGQTAPDQPAPEQVAAGETQSIRPAARPAALMAPAAPPVPETQVAKLEPEAGSVVALSAPAPTRPAAAAAPAAKVAQARTELAPVAPAPVPFAAADATTEAMAGGQPVELAAMAVPKPKRNAPIYETAQARPKARAEEEVVSRVSTSGGRHYGINVGRFNTRMGAEAALTKTQLSESATLNGALRKVVQGKSGFDGVYMGLTQEQAERACARLQARAMQCFTIGE